MICYEPWPIGLMYESPEPELECIGTPYGYAERVKSGDGYVLHRVITTDLSVYLKADSAPGTVFSIK